MNVSSKATFVRKTLTFAHLTIKDIAAAFSHQPWAIWLDSGNSDHVDANYDILVFNPVITLKTAITSTRIYDCRNDQLTISQEDPLSLIDTAMADVFQGSTPEHNDLPFCGGALGYFSYDLGRRFERLPATSMCDITLPEMAIGIYTSALVYNHKTKQFTLISHQDRKSVV